MMFSGGSRLADFAEYSRARLFLSASEPLMAPYVRVLEVSNTGRSLSSESSRSWSMEIDAQQVSAMLNWLPVSCWSIHYTRSGCGLSAKSHRNGKPG